VRIARIAAFLVLALLGTVLVVSDYSRRYAATVFTGVHSSDYSEPRIEVRLEPGPPQPRVSPAEAGIDPAAIAAALAYADPRNTRALVVGHKGHIVFEHYAAGTSAETQVDLAGFTPVLAALLVGTAQVERRIPSIDAPVSNYLDEWREDEVRGANTLRGLLSLTDLLADAGGWPLPHSRAARLALSTNVESLALEWPAAPGAQGIPPGVSPARGDLHTREVGIQPQLLALVLARRAGHPYQDLIAKELWMPLGGGTFSMSLDRANGQVRAHTGLRARLGDWMRVGELLANGGVFEGNQLMPPGWVKLMLAASPNNPRGFFARTDGEFAARDVAWLEADGKQRLWIVPSLRLSILRLGGDPSEIHGWDERVIPDSIIRGTSGWVPQKGQGTDPSQFAPH
jgi:CubicO group peptidase (beta-lactamase class C family)